MRPFLALTLALTCCLTAQCHAGTLRIKVLDGTINAGGSGFLDVLISSEFGNPVEVNIANYEFLIEPISTPVGRLQFGAQISDNSGDPSIPYFMSGVGIGIARDINTDDQTLVATELSNSGIVDAIVQAPSLLVRFELVHDLGGHSAMDAVGEQFKIRLNQGINTFFESSAALVHDIESVDGKIEITQPQVVPEPVSCLVFACGFATLFAVRRRSRCT